MYAESQGVSEYFTKPVKLDKLISCAEKLVAPRRRRLRRRCDGEIAWHHFGMQ